MGKLNSEKNKKSLIRKVWDRVIGTFSETDNIIPFKTPKQKCTYCDAKPAKWKNTVYTDYTCDDCVPRGCSCKLYRNSRSSKILIRNYDYELDEQGRELPCEDWIKLH